MTFELSAEQLALQARAREFAAVHVVPVAAVIDNDGTIPSALTAALAGSGLLASDGSVVDAVVVLEQLARTSAAVATAAGLAFAARRVDEAGPGGGARADAAGLRGLDEAGAASAADAARERAALAAVAVGIGHAAIDEALAVMRASGDRPSGGADERPHWALADAATEVAAAELLTQQAAQALDGGAGQAEASLAKGFAADAAARAVDASLRIIGPDGYRRGTLTERLTRDVRALSLLGGTADEQRATVAELMLPQS